MGMFDGFVEKMSSMVDDVKKATNEPRIWEYMDLPVGGDESIKGVLDHFGAEGWEAYAVDRNPRNPSEFHAFLKREVRKEAPTT